MEIWTALAHYSFFETEKLLLRPLSFLDTTDFFEISSDQDNLSFVFPVCLKRSESDYLFVHSFLKEPLGIWGITEKNSHRLIGVIRLENIDEHHSSSEIGYFMNAKFRNKGYMTEALKNIVLLAFDELGLTELNLLTHLENEASQHVALNAGFRCISRFKGSDRYNHRIRQYLAYQLKK
ncbi:GNAT family N-acetyltransferase [Streptococcus hongkongensis]|nr:GNAT family acetyltransferase [Streptococcus uberis]